MLRNLAKTIAVVVGSTLLATLAVNAFDFRDHYHTLLGGLLFSTQSFQSTCPNNMVHVSQTLNPFCIDMYEVSAHEACTYQDPKSADESIFNLSDTACIPVANKERMPWRHVTRDLAERACVQAGKRLPTPNEWFVAAFGTPDLSNGWNEEDCNVAYNREKGVSETGGGTRCISSAGAYDMIGNVWEWVDGTVNMGMYTNSILPASGFVTEASQNGLAYTTGTEKSANYFNDRFWTDPTIEAGIMRGGYFNNYDDAGLYATYAASPVTFSGDALGFRCVVSVDSE